MNRVLYPDDSSAAPLPGSSAERELPDFRRWLAEVQSGLRTAPGEAAVRPSPDDHSPREPGSSPEFSAQDGRHGQNS